MEQKERFEVWVNAQSINGEFYEAQLEGIYQATSFEEAVSEHVKKNVKEENKSDWVYNKEKERWEHTGIPVCFSEELAKEAWWRKYGEEPRD